MVDNYFFLPKKFLKKCCSQVLSKIVVQKLLSKNVMSKSPAFLNMTEFVLNMIIFVLNLSGCVLGVTGFFLIMTEFVRNVKKFAMKDFATDCFAWLKFVVRPIISTFQG